MIVYELASSILLCLTLALLIVPGRSTQEDLGSAEIDTFIQERMQSLDVPGAAVAIVRGDEIVHLAGYGVANAAGDPVTPRTPFLLASISKSMTALAVMQLVEEDRVDLDAPVQRYLPWFIPGEPITVRQLLNQTSGLDERQGYERNLEPDGPDALQQSVRRLATAQLNRPPGSAFEYSNSNYDVLGALIETVSGQNYGEYLQSHLFDPLGMDDTFTSLASAREAGMSSAYYPFFGRQIVVDDQMPYSRATQPSAGIISSAADIATYLIVHLNDGRYGELELLSAENMATLHTPPSGSVQDVGYAMGWVVWEFTEAVSPDNPNDIPIGESHGGTWLGFVNTMVLVPEEDLGVILLMTGHDPMANSTFHDVSFDVALLAMGFEPQSHPPQEGVMTLYSRQIAAGIVGLLLGGVALALWRLRAPHFGRWDKLLFVLLAILDVGLIIWLLLIRLPSERLTVRQTLFFMPDVGLLLVIVLLLTIVWGTVRSLWAIQRWRQVHS